MNPSLFLIGSATPKPFGELGIGPLNLNRVAVTQGYRIAILGGICFADHDFKRRGIHGRHLTRLRPNFSAYLDYRLQKDAALIRVWRRGSFPFEETFGEMLDRFTEDQRDYG